MLAPLQKSSACPHRPPPQQQSTVTQTMSRTAGALVGAVLLGLLRTRCSSSFHEHAQSMANLCSCHLCTRAPTAEQRWLVVSMCPLPGAAAAQRRGGNLRGAKYTPSSSRGHAQVDHYGQVREAIPDKICRPGDQLIAHDECLTMPVTCAQQSFDHMTDTPNNLALKQLSLKPTLQLSSKVGC